MFRTLLDEDLCPRNKSDPHPRENPRRLHKSHSKQPAPMVGAKGSCRQGIGELAEHSLAIPTVMVAGDRVGIGEKLECAMRIAGAINQVADRKHTARSMFRKQSSSRAQSKILAMNIAEDADLPGKRVRVAHDVAS